MTRYLGRLAFIAFSTQFCFWYTLHAFRPYRLSPSQAAVRVLKGQSHLKGLSYFKSFITCAGSILTSLKPSTGFTTNCCSKSSTDSASAVALLTWFEDSISLTTSKGSPLSESKARLSLCHLACEPQTHFRSSLLSLRKEKRRPEMRLRFAGYVSSGVRQGSILGPLLFLIYVTEWPSGDVATSVSLFADDKRCFWKMKSLEDGACLQRDLEHINAWCDFCPGVGGGGYFGNFWVGMCSWDPGTHNLNQS